MKRTGNLYDRICTQEALLAAFHRASQRKRTHRACFDFGRNLGTALARLEKELVGGMYQPRPFNRFMVHDGRKPRLIEAPAFRDLVVQHAIYREIAPIFDRRYISTNFACREGKGTHAAADWLQRAIRRAPRTSWILHVDVRKFFYSINREVLQALLAKAIKCDRTLVLMTQFAVREESCGVPIGNLLSQTFANVYLNSLDHFCKRVLKIADYGRYMDDSVMLAPSRATAMEWLAQIDRHLALLDLEISHYYAQPIQRGANFVGFRTWSSARFVRPHVISSMRSDARAGRLDRVISRLGHARRTCSFQYCMSYLLDHYHDIYIRLPETFKRIHRHQYDAARV